MKEHVVDMLQKLIEAIATLLWPLIVIAVLILAHPAIVAIIESAKSRKFTLKIGGQELSMEEANQVQQNLIADLQTQVVKIQSQIALLSNVPGASVPAALSRPSVPLHAESVPAPTLEPVALTTSTSLKTPTILWADDNPKNNSYLIQQLAQSGIQVDLAKSTAEGMERFNSQEYDYVISDMGRQEGLLFRKTAGFDLLKAIRATGSTVPFLLFCSPSGVDHYANEALQLGAIDITASPTQLMGILNRAFAEHPA